jgi:hypothetical protein
MWGWLGRHREGAESALTSWLVVGEAAMGLRRRRGSYRCCLRRSNKGCGHTAGRERMEQCYHKSGKEQGYATSDRGRGEAARR